MTLLVTFWSDYACPYCYVGECVAERAMTEEPFDMRWRGFELHPEVPDTGLGLRELLPALDPHCVVSNLERLCDRHGLELCVPDRFYPTRRALVLGERARQIGRLDAFRKAAMEHIWGDGGEVFQIDTLAELAKRADLPSALLDDLDGSDAQRTLAQCREDAEDAMVTCIPTCFAGPFPLVGVQTVETFVRWVRRAKERGCAA